MTDMDRDRFSRHLLLPEVGEAGQSRLQKARVALVGLGGLGCPAALYLAAAGVGTLRVFDADVVSLSNLQRQVLFTTEDVGRAKVDAASDRLKALWPRLHVEAYPVRLTAANAKELLAGCDVVVDGSDNFPTRYLTGDASVLLGIPLVYGAVERFGGQVTTFVPKLGPCYRCLFPDPPEPGTVPTCEEAGVLGVVPGQVGLMQATEALKLILGAGEPLTGRLQMFDVLAGSTRTVVFRRNSHCAVCGDHPTISQLEDIPWSCGAASAREISAEELRGQFERGEKIAVIDVRNGSETDGGVVPGAVCLPLPSLDQSLDRVRSLVATGTPVVVMCQRGGRSAKAIQQLQAAGIVGLVNLRGGFESWQAVGGAVGRPEY